MNKEKETVIDCLNRLTKKINKCEFCGADCFPTKPAEGFEKKIG